MNQRVTLQRFRRGRWRAWLALYALVALIWPAVAPLPWLIDFAGAGHRADQSVAHDHADGHATTPHSHHDASEVPGSPTHPDDHDCFQCQVIKHLARCVPSACAYPAVARVANVSPAPPSAVASVRAAFVVPRPPIRGPPLLAS
jgi:hypothetical protein